MLPEAVAGEHLLPVATADGGSCQAEVATAALATVPTTGVPCGAPVAEACVEDVAVPALARLAYVPCPAVMPSLENAVAHGDAPVAAAPRVGACSAVGTGLESWVHNYVRHLWGMGPQPCPVYDVSVSGRGLLALCDPAPHLPGGTAVLEARLATTACRLPLDLCLAALPEPMSAWVREVRLRRPLRVDVWREAFAEDPDLDFLLYLVDTGVHVLPVDRVPAPFHVPNHRSFADALALAAPLVAQEVADGWLVPAPAGCASLFVHPLGAVPKGESVRVIHDLSCPKGGSVNDLQRHWRRSWLCADSIMAMLRPGDWIAKTDVSAYYRHFPIHPAQWPLLACHVDGQDLWDTRLPFGLRTAPEVADRVTAALSRRATATGGVERMAAIVDDFTFFSQCPAKCAQDWKWFMADCQRLGLSMNQPKSAPPAQRQKVVGIVFDSVAMSASLDADKIAALKGKLLAFVGQRKCRVSELLSLLGHLYYASRVVFAGRAFVFHLAALLRAAHGKPVHHRLHLTAAARADVQWWLGHVDRCNGGQAILPHAPVLWRVFQTDASLTGAAGQPCIGVWLHGGYVSLSAADLRSLFADVPCLGADINVWEMYAVVVACRLFAEYMAGQHWRVRTDNAACEAWLMRGVRSSPLVAAWLSELMGTCLEHGFRLSAKHIPGAENQVADALSRRNWVAFAACLQRHKVHALDAVL